MYDTALKFFRLHLPLTKFVATLQVLILISSILATYLIMLPKDVYAACSMTVTPTSGNLNTTFTVTVNGVEAGEDYRIEFRSEGLDETFGGVNFYNPTTGQYTTTWTPSEAPSPPGENSLVSVVILTWNADGTNTQDFPCQNSPFTITIGSPLTPSDCNITANPSLIDGTNDTTITITGLDPGYEYNFASIHTETNTIEMARIEAANSSGVVSFSHGYSSSEMPDGNYSISYFKVGNPSDKCLQDDVFTLDRSEGGGTWDPPGGELPGKAHESKFADIIDPVKNTFGSLGSIVTKAVPFIFGFATMLATLFLIWGGFRYMTSQGDEKQVAEARTVITSAIIGLVIIFSVAAIAQLLEILFKINIIG